MGTMELVVTLMWVKIDNVREMPSKNTLDMVNMDCLSICSFCF